MGGDRGDPSIIIYGKEIARVGDQVLCPRCKGSFPIVSGATDVFSGEHIARQDDFTGCGAKLIASQSTAIWSDETEEASAMASAPDSSVLESTWSSSDDEPHTIRFQAVHPATGQPLPKRPYILTRENGVQHGGLTDAQGYTEEIETTEPEQIAVHFMFADADGQTIDREDLLP